MAKFTIADFHPGEIMEGSNDDDVIKGGKGHQEIYGFSGNDRIWGGNGIDWIYGDRGIDRIWGGKGNDDIAGGYGHDRLWGGKGDDILWGGTGNDRLFGGEGDDKLLSDQGRDHLHGGAGDDLILAGFGADVIFGGKGDDILWGDRDIEGQGYVNAPRKDRFNFDDESGHDIIKDYQAGKDVLVFHDAKEREDLIVKDSEGGAVITGALDDWSVTLVGVEAGDLTESDFVFLG